MGFFIFVLLVLVATCATSMLLSVRPSGSALREEIGHYLWGLLVGLAAALYALFVYSDWLSPVSENDPDVNPVAFVGIVLWRVVLPFVGAFTVLTLVRVAFVSLVRWLRKKNASS